MATKSNEKLIECIGACLCVFPIFAIFAILFLLGLQSFGIIKILVFQ